MKVLILRTPGLDLIHDLALKGIEIPKDLVEGQERQLSAPAAKALIELFIAAELGEPAPAALRRAELGGRGGLETKGQVKAAAGELAELGRDRLAF